jgi:hypothetical protein
MRVLSRMPFEVSVKDRMMYSHTFVFGDGVPFTTGCTAVVTASIEVRVSVCGLRTRERARVRMHACVLVCCGK